MSPGGEYERTPWRFMRSESTVNARLSSHVEPMSSAKISEKKWLPAMPFWGENRDSFIESSFGSASPSEKAEEWPTAAESGSEVSTGF